MIKIKELIKVFKENKQKELDCAKLTELAGINKSSVNKQVSKLKLYGYKINIRVVVKKGHEKRIFCYVGELD